MSNDRDRDRDRDQLLAAIEQAFSDPDPISEEVEIRGLKFRVVPLASQAMRAEFDAITGSGGDSLSAEGIAALSICVTELNGKPITKAARQALARSATFRAAGGFKIIVEAVGRVTVAYDAIVTEALKRPT
jgi:hypothetical protein